jgi:tetraacyldisaccharide 4'-kinase
MIRLLLYPLAIIYGIIVKIRNFFFDVGLLSSQYFNFPVISVGNITVGGTGKTPHVEYLVKILQDKFKVSTLSRGYKRKTKGFVLATSESTSAQIGDEPAQIKKKFPNIAVAVDENRCEGIKLLIEQKNEVILLDDAFQHRYVKPGLSILLIDFNRRIDKDYLLPFGNLRESASAKKRADIIIVTKTPLDLRPIDRRIFYEQIKPAPYQELYFTGFKYGNLQPVFKTSSSIPANFYNNHQIYTILLITGIAFAKPLIDQLKEYTMDIRHQKFADHAEYNQSKFDKIVRQFSDIDNEKKIIITTEKDAIKMRETGIKDSVLTDNMFYLPIEVKFIDKEEEFNQKINKYVRQNKSNNGIHSKANKN